MGVRKKTERSARRGKMWKQRARLLQRALLQSAQSMESASSGGCGGNVERRHARRAHRLATWGNGDQGRLGLSSTISQWTPTLCSSPSDPVAVACGGAHTLVLTGSGRVFASGLNDYGQLGLPLDVSHSLQPVDVEGLPDRCIHISAGYHHSAAISADGDVFVWGSNLHSQLGLGRKAPNSTSSPVQVEALKDLRLKGLALGSEHSLGLTEDGEVLSWGSGQFGQLGHGEPNGMFRYLRNSSVSAFVPFHPVITRRLLVGSRTCSQYSPRLIGGLRNVQVQAIAAGLMHSACVDERGNLYTFGHGRMCQLGHGNERDSSEPLPVSNLPSCTGVACGAYHTGAITRNGDLYMWGSNEYGCLGFGYQHTEQMVFPMKVEGRLAGMRVSEVSCGWKHTCALTVDGVLYAWGWGGSQGTYSADGHSSGGQLGLGNEFDFNEPSHVSTNGMHAVHISCGFNHTAAILSEW